MDEVRRGLRDMWAVGIGLIPLGLAFGLLVVQMGYAWWWTPIFSIVIYAGSMEFLAVGLVTAGTGWLAAGLTGFLVNFRHLFYGLTYPLHWVRGVFPRAYTVYAMTDEDYALTGRFGADGVDPKTGEPVTSTRLLTITAACQVAWVASGIVGALGGSAVRIPWEGLEFAMTALFAVLAYDSFMASRDWSLVVFGIGFGAVAALIAPSQMLLVAFVLYFLMVFARSTSSKMDAALTWRTRGAAQGGSRGRERGV